MKPIDIIKHTDEQDIEEWGVLFEDGSCKWFATEQEAIQYADWKENE